MRDHPELNLFIAVEFVLGALDDERTIRSIIIHCSRIRPQCGGTPGKPPQQSLFMPQWALEFHLRAKRWRDHHGFAHVEGYGRRSLD